MTRTDGARGDGFALWAEVEPPKGTDFSEFEQAALAIRGRVDAVVVTDGNGAIMRMTPLVPCGRLIGHNLEPVMMLNGRDRNRITFQGDLLGASALGVRRVLIGQGQDPAVGDQPMVRTSGDLDLATMLQAAGALNKGQDMAGEALTGKAELSLGVCLDVSDDVNANRRQAEGLKALADQGVETVVLGPHYDVNILDLFARAAEDAGLSLMTSIMLLKSVAMIRYLNNLPGLPAIPHEFLKRMTQAPVKKDAGMEIADGFLADIQDRCRGAVLIAVGWGKRLPEFLERIGR